MAEPQAPVRGLKRKVESDLLAWRHASTRTAVRVSGVRQVGKTELIRRFARAHYEHVLEINFEKEPEARAIFSGSLAAKHLIPMMSAYAGHPVQLIPGKTLIFFDAIEACPQARTAIKFLAEDGRFDYAEAGEYLSVNTQEVASLPVEFEKPVTLRPLDFEEFCLACGVPETTLASVRESFEMRKPVASSVHERMQQLFLTYLVVGGMPACVEAYLKTNDMAAVGKVQRITLSRCREDIACFGGRHATKALTLFDAIPKTLAAGAEQFLLAEIAKTTRLSPWKDASNWLWEANLAVPAFCLSELKRPLRCLTKRWLFRLFGFDTGLLTAAGGERVQSSILQGDASVMCASVLKNAVAQELASHGLSLGYPDTTSAADFGVDINGRTVLIAVTAGGSGQARRELETIVKQKPQD